MNVFMLKIHTTAICFPVVLTWSCERCNPINCPPVLRPHSHWFCRGVCGWGWGGWRGRRLKCGRSAATRSSGHAGRGCIGRSHSAEWRTWVSSGTSGTGRGGTVDTERSGRVWHGRVSVWNEQLCVENVNHVYLKHTADKRQKKCHNIPYTFIIILRIRKEIKLYFSWMSTQFKMHHSYFRL